MTTNFSTTAMLYLANALCPLPASKETKCPTIQWKAYQDRLPTEAEWDKWGKTARGICILTGKISGYLIVFDFDDKGSRFDAWCKLLPQELIERFVIVQTQSGGKHIYVRCEGKPMGSAKLTRTAENKTLIETKGEGGLVIAPPTPGYKILSGSLESIPVLSPNEIELLVNAARSLDEMSKRGMDMIEDIALPELVIDVEEAVRRAIAYIGAMPPAIQGNNGSAATMRVCNKLHEFGFDRETAKRVFMEHYNPRCQPEWSEKEIDHKLDTAYNKPLKEAGCMLETHVTTDAVSNSPVKKNIVEQPAIHGTNTSPMPVREFPVEVLPEGMRNVVELLAKQFGVTKAAVAYPMLPHAAAAVGDSVRIKCFDDAYPLPIVLWTATIVGSGIKKTNIMMRLRRSFDDLEDQAKAIYEAAVSQYKSDKKAGLECRLPMRKNYVSGQATMERLLLDCCKESMGLIYSECEGKLFFGGFDQYRGGGQGTDEAVYCKLYDGGRIKFPRKTSETAEGKGLLFIALAIQPVNFVAALQANTGMQHSGLLARFDIAMPEVLPPSRVQRGMDYTPLNDWSDRIRRIIQNRGDIQQTLYLDDAAMKLFDDYAYECCTLARRAGDGWLGSYYNRLQDKAAKVAAVMRCYEGCDGLMTAQQLERGITIAEYFRHETERIAAQFTGTGADTLTKVAGDRKAMAILNAIDEKGAITKAELHLLYIFKGVSKAADVIEAKLLELRKYGLIKSEFVKDPKGGRGKEIYRRSSPGSGSETSENPSENEGSTSTADDSDS